MMERTNPNIISFPKPSEEDLKRLDELTLGKKPVSSISFTISVLGKLHEFICSEMVEEKEWFCDYEKQALIDALFYLRILNG